MSDISIIHDAAREVSSRGMKAFTFTIGGQSSGYWARTKAAIERQERLEKEAKQEEKQKKKRKSGAKKTKTN